MNERLKLLKEPGLEFRYGQYMEDPHDGLSMFGPYGIDAGAHPENITLGLIATTEGAQRFTQWCRVAKGAIYPGKNRAGKELDPHRWPVFPGFEAAFCSELPREPAWIHELDPEKLKLASQDKDPNKRASSVVQHYLDAIAVTEKKDETFDVLVCVVPDHVWKNCRPQSYVPGGVGYAVSGQERQRRAAGQTDFFESYEPETYQYSVDFRRQLKARCMKHKIPIQIIRESRLSVRPEELPRLQSPPSDFAWNLLTTMYYKSGGKPWRLAGARPGVCYIGIAFRRTDFTAGNRTACCAAQMFLDSGDGIVFLSDEYGPWYSPEDKQFHLSAKAAQKLLSGVLKTYEDLGGQPLNEIFLHSRSTILENEFDGYRAACPSRVGLVGICVRKDNTGIRLYREGTRPPLRGTFWAATPTLGYLWASGFVPRLKTYAGWESPVPLKIEIQHREADIEQVGRDILALTKLNFNACRYGDSEPVTIGFSDSVGEILVSNPTVKDRSPRFKFYI